MNKERLFTPLLVILVVPVVLMMAMAWIVTDLEIVGNNEATREFMEARSVFGGLRPILSADQAGKISVAIEQLDFSRPEASDLHILFWRNDNSTLAYTRVPIWLRTLKGPVSRYVLRSSGFDLNRLPLSARDLRLRGSSLLLDYTENNGNRLMLWIK
jgi:hypothetical protein